jgi:hypothetical protein
MLLLSSGLPLSHQHSYPTRSSALEKSTVGEVRNVTKMKSGSLLVECYRQQQSINLLSATTILETEISATPWPNFWHRKQRVGFGMYWSTFILYVPTLIVFGIDGDSKVNRYVFNLIIVPLGFFSQLAVFYAKSLVMESSHVEVTPNVTDVRRKVTMA